MYVTRILGKNRFVSLRIIIRKYKWYEPTIIPNTRSFVHRGVSNVASEHVKPVYINSTDIKCDVNKYTIRTYTCGELRLNNVGERITLCGWVEYHRMKKFLVLRDAYGQTQLIAKENDNKTQSIIQQLPYETIVSVEGQVVARPTDMINKKQETGAIEVVIEKINILNSVSTKLPFNIREFQRANESLRMQHRYMDLRFLEMQRNLRTRSEMFMRMREFLVRRAHFVEVETPTLFKATPGGAQEFVVPTRNPGLFYTLTQSPQQFKQMLMAGGIDRYFQVARCYRDEGSRPDRQPEFTQLDIEMSFTTVEGVMRVVEDLLQFSWPTFLPTLPNTFQRMTYKDAIERYGTDKPDTRYKYELRNCSHLFDHLSRESDLYAACLTFDSPCETLSASIKQHISTLQKKSFPNVRLTQKKVHNKNNWIEGMSKVLSQGKATELYDKFIQKDDTVTFLAYGTKTDTLSLLGKVRLQYLDHLQQKGVLKKSNEMCMLWIVDFPLCEAGDSSNSFVTVHHPFTAPHPDDIEKLQSSPLTVRALAYDLVLNGNEIGGGSIRIHDPQLQEEIFKLFQIDVGSMQYLLEMLGSGCPPHGGIALGLDRLLAVILNTQSIRDVIAFPKTFEGKDPISGAPSPISDHDQKIYHICVKSGKD